ncbi:hypothetical protein M5E06_16875 [Azospirillum sp. A1-3]|uniref:hypothetical protein n=1 Tax=Azospirillum sp. A1-3 TaxID=185874 RepID=UPI00207715F2|nr:hypothetical protein [Azospirillum sp. A1-3]MCM8735817.1 hypothetical protein [Azospirillum sp. A1-3]
MPLDRRTLLKATAATGALAARQLHVLFASPGPHSFSPVLTATSPFGRGGRWWSDLAPATLDESRADTTVTADDAFAVSMPLKAVRVALGGPKDRQGLREALRQVADLLAEAPAMSSMIV